MKSPEAKQKQREIPPRGLDNVLLCERRNNNLLLFFSLYLCFLFGEFAQQFFREGDLAISGRNWCTNPLLAGKGGVKKRS